MFRPFLMAAFLLVPAPVLAQAKAPVRSVPRAQVVANAEREFVTIDTNKDGSVSRIELENFQNAAIVRSVNSANAAAFARLDQDRNGQLTAAEFAKISPVPKADVSPAFQADTNKDFKISLTEHRAATIAKFNKLDGNKDGILTAEEIRAATAAAKK